MVRVLFFDTQRFFLDVVSSAIGSHADMKVVSTSTNAADAPMLCEREKPNVILMDANLPHSKSITEKIRENFPEIKIIVLWDYPGIIIEKAVKKIGAHSFIPKTASANRLFREIRKKIKEAPRKVPGTI
jgi:DNA-binding NarL/FixJ family response regulator